MWVTLTLHTLSEPLPRPQLHACNKSMHAEEIFWDCQTFVSWLNKVRTEETKYRLHTFQKGAWNRERQRERDAEPHTNKAKKNKKKYKKNFIQRLINMVHNCGHVNTSSLNFPAPELHLLSSNHEE